MITTITRLRKRTYEASAMGLSGYGETKTAAKKALAAEITLALDRQQQGPVTVQVHGVRVHVYPGVGQWEYTAGCFRPDFRQGMSGEREAVVSCAVAHVGQVLWNRDVADDGVFLAGIPDAKAREELRSWVKWQREYARLQAEGLADAEIRARI